MSNSPSSSGLVGRSKWKESRYGESGSLEVSVAEVSDGEVLSSTVSGDVGEGATVVVLQAENWLRNSCGRSALLGRAGGLSVLELLILVVAFCGRAMSGAVVDACVSKLSTATGSLVRRDGYSKLVEFAACDWCPQRASESVGDIAFWIPKSFGSLWAPCLSEPTASSSKRTEFLSEDVPLDVDHE